MAPSVPIMLSTQHFPVFKESSMPSAKVPESQQSTAAPAALRGHPGCWRLEVGRTLALTPRQRSVLRVVQGRVWVTQAQDPRHGGAREADAFVGPGECWEAEPGRLVVLEPVGPGPAQAVAFRWEPVRAAVPARARLAWAAAVRPAWCDLQQALREAARALRGVVLALLRLAAGLLRWWLRRPAPVTGLQR
jgi:hypothetical protein